MKPPRIAIVGAGAAGFLAAITVAETAPGTEVIVIEKGQNVLAKVRISGGGRCNLTNACFDERDLASNYPRGGRALLGAFHLFQPRDTITWFESRGVKLKTEDDGRVFPQSDTSQTIIDCLQKAAALQGIILRINCRVEGIIRREKGGYELTLSRSERLHVDRVLLSTGGCSTESAEQLVTSLGHTLEPPVPSLFTFTIKTPWVHELAGISLENVEASVANTNLKERGGLLFTHWGVSGPVILRLSAWGACDLHRLNYHFPLRLNWLPDKNAEKIALEFDSCRLDHPARQVINSPLPPVPARLWEKLVRNAKIAHQTRWAELSRSDTQKLIEQLSRTELKVSGRSPNKEEFVTCGGVRLGEVDFKTMESRICPGLYFAGELLDIDGITGGFNLQAAWTTGWIAGRAMGQL